MSKKKRAEFSGPTKDLIAKRAGYRCSFPGCGKTLVGPGVQSDEHTLIGECAHIFAAVPNGPRTDGGLSGSQLERPENGIFLCLPHHKIVDRKAKSSKYTSDFLTRFKSRHEFLISAELGEYQYPLNWISHLKIKGTIFKNDIDLNLGKVTLITGTNGVGKSTVTEVLDSCFRQKIHSRWDRPNIQFTAEITLDNPVMSKFTGVIRDNKIHYEVNKTLQPFVPYDFFVLHLKERIRSNNDDLKTISDCLGLDRAFVKSMLSTIGVKHGVVTKKIRVDERRTKLYLVDELNVDIGNWWPQSFKSCSSTEQASVILDIAFSFATEISKFKSVLLLVDWPGTYNFDDKNISRFLEFLQNHEAHFQTVFVSHHRRPNLDWSGWVIADFKRTSTGVMVIQDKL